MHKIHCDNYNKCPSDIHAKQCAVHVTKVWLWKMMYHVLDCTVCKQQYVENLEMKNVTVTVPVRQ